MEYTLERFEQGRLYAFKKANIHSLDSLRRRVIGEDVSVKETRDAWLVETNIEIFHPASLEQVQYVERKFQVTLPMEYKNLLLLANGIELFILKHKKGYPITYCSLLSHVEVVKTYRALLGIAMLMLDDPHIDNLFYLPVAAMENSTFIGLSTHPETFGEVFELYTDSGYIPYTPGYNTDQHYKKKYPNFKGWLDLVLDTHGAEGLTR